MPQNEQEWMELSREFEAMWNFQHCIGACDGKHIVIQCPQKSGSTYYNYKGTFSIVLMAVVDAKYCFTYVHIGCQGRISDGGVFRDTTFCKRLFENQLCLPSPVPLPGREKPSPYVLVADDAFPLQVNIMKPFSGQHEKGSPERMYNYRLSRARRVVENAFGLLASVFRVFRKPMLINVQHAEVVSTACVYLHNFLRMSATSRSLYSPQGSFDLDTQDGTIIDGAWRKVISGDTGMVDLQRKPRRPSSDAKEVREEFKEYFVSNAGKVPWQDLYA